MRTQATTPFSKWVSYQHNYQFVDLVNSLDDMKCLYVGMRHDSEDYWYDMLIENGNTVDILEIHQPNVDYLKSIDPQWSVVQGDILTHPLENYDCLFWLQGPEHCTKEQLMTFLPKVLSLKHYYLSVPDADITWHPNVEQGAVFNNQYEVHQSKLNKRFFLQFFPEDQLLLEDHCVIVRK